MQIQPDFSVVLLISQIKLVQNVDGFVVTVPAENKEVYRKMAAKAAPFLKASGEKGPEPQERNEFGLTVDEFRRPGPGVEKNEVCQAGNKRCQHRFIF